MKNTAWRADKERSNPFFIKLICWIALHLSRPFARFWLYPITAYFLFTSPKVRSASSNYFDRIDGKHGLFQSAKHIFCFSATILDRVYFLTGQCDKFDIKIHNIELIDKLVHNKTGCILLGTHIGSFDVLQCLSARHDYESISLMMDKGHNSMITDALYSLNPKVADTIIDVTDSNALLQVKERVDQGGFVGMLGDRAVEGEKQVQCQLLGEAVLIPSAPFAIANVLQVPIITFVGVYLGGNRYHIYFEELPYNEQINRQQTIKEQSQTYMVNIEKTIKHHPYNWFNFYDFWGDAK